MDIRFLWVALVSLCLVLFQFSTADDSDFQIEDEGCSSCGSPKSRDFKATPQESSSKEKPNPRVQAQTRGPQGGMEGRGPQPELSEEEIMRTLENMPSEHREEFLAGYREYLKQEEQKPEVQEQLHNSFPKLNYPDTAYKSFKQIPKSKIPPKTFGCGEVYIEPGKFTMGSEDDENYKEDGESPTRRVKIKSGFWMDACEVTNGQFLHFWDSSNFVNKTEAEKYGWTFVFELAVSDEINSQITTAVQGAEWWVPVPNADFRHPEGPDKNFNEKLNHPVIHVGWTDANKYCQWRNGRLPSEAEWEYSARGGLESKKFPWGDEIQPFKDINGTFSMNIFTGTPYTEDDGSDGWKTTAIVGSFNSNNFGLYDMTGNVWEWVNDVWTDKPQIPKEGQRLVDPKGPKPKRGRTDRVMKGGSYMCHQTTCRRYRCSGRAHAEPDSSTGNLGFRCVYDKKPNDNVWPMGIEDEL